MKRVALSFASKEAAAKILRDMADDMEREGMARAEFVDEDSQDGSPLTIARNGLCW